MLNVFDRQDRHGDRDTFQNTEHHPDFYQEKDSDRDGQRDRDRDNDRNCDSDWQRERARERERSKERLGRAGPTSGNVLGLFSGPIGRATEVAPVHQSTSAPARGAGAAVARDEGWDSGGAESGRGTDNTDENNS